MATKEPTHDFAPLPQSSALEISQDSKDPQPVAPPALVEEDVSSLWQYCIHDKHSRASFWELLLPISVVIYYLSSFYCIIAMIHDQPPARLLDTQRFSNRNVIYIAKYFFTIFLLIQAECECFDGWKMLSFADGHPKRILFFGFMQYFTGCVVEIISFSLINRANTIIQIMGNSASLTVFLRIDDVVISSINKFFPKNKKKVSYNKSAFEKNNKSFIFWTVAVKIAYFVLAEFLNEVFHISIFI